MNSRHAHDLIGFDVETTGVDPKVDRIVTASVVVLDGQDSIKHRHEWLVNPGIDIPEAAAAIHGVSTEHAQAHGQPAAQAVAEIIATLNTYLVDSPLVVFNAPYDLSILHAEAGRYALTPFQPTRVLDPLVMDRQVDRYRSGRRTLQAVSDHYGVTLEDAHSAHADAVACVQVARELVRQYPQLQLASDELHDQQVTWARDQAASLQEYFRRSRPTAVVDGTWPLRLT